MNRVQQLRVKKHFSFPDAYFVLIRVYIHDVARPIRG